MEADTAIRRGIGIATVMQREMEREGISISIETARERGMDMDIENTLETDTVKDMAIVTVIALENKVKTTEGTNLETEAAKDRDIDEQSQIMLPKPQY